ncbi:hypothetical protein M0R45_005311 [Rubus argutus]|uniref:Uncharacterized protein n=1 Tax=Rubus argutus TaxID=59490 RepID=A0AAW1YMI4_RUBAR
MKSASLFISDQLYRYWAGWPCRPYHLVTSDYIAVVAENQTTHHNPFLLRRNDIQAGPGAADHTRTSSRIVSDWAWSWKSLTSCKKRSRLVTWMPLMVSS